MNSDQTRKQPAGITRRQFVHSAAAAGLAVSLPAWAQEPTSAAESAEELAIAMIGPGSQGRYLITQCLRIPGIRFVAVCDIWPYHQEYAARLLKRYDQVVNVYEDYREMLDKEKHLDAVIITTPDWVHAEQTVACLRAGKHVFCEKEMSNSIDGARQMVVAARQTGKLLQIGHQRRSSPIYFHARQLIEKDRILGRITHAFGQWNRARLLEVGFPRGREMDADTLRRYGYENMEQFCNWRWYRRFSGGPLSDLGSHQIAVFNWFLGCPPKSVLAGGGLDYYTEQPGRDWYDNVMAIYEYNLPAGPVRGFYQVLNTTSHGGVYEAFMGDEGSLMVSEMPDKNLIFREQHAKRREWEDMAARVESMGREAIELKIGETLTPTGEKDPAAQQMLVESQKPPQRLHLENFFNAIRAAAPLNCPAEAAFEVCVSVLRANDAVASGRRYDFSPEEFHVPA